MKFIGLNGREYTIDLKRDKYPIRNAKNKKSNLQYEVGNGLRKVFPRMTILEEFVIPGSQLRIDFFIPEIPLAIEANGEQHYRYVKFFHGSRANFQKAKARDVQKRNWCDLNEINFVSVTSADNIRGQIEQQLFR